MARRARLTEPDTLLDWCWKAATVIILEKWAEFATWLQCSLETLDLQIKGAMLHFEAAFSSRLVWIK
jgi:hypothetical protein